MTSELSMNGKKKIETLQKEFTQKFPYLTLVFLDKDKRAIDISKSLSEVRQAKGDDISIIASLKINTLEKRFLENFGLVVEVAYKKSDKVVYTKENVDKTLNELNKWCEENGCQPFEFKKTFTGNTLSSVQEQLFEAIKESYPNAEAKKINKDNYLDIYVPEINKKRGTHLFFNTAKDGIKVGFYCRDEDFIENVLSKSENIEKYAQGIRILNNPILNDVDDAITNALSFINEILNISDTGSNSGIKVEKNVEDETSDTEEEINLDELINKFVEKQGTDALNDYLETYLQKGQIVVTEISAFGLIKLISKDDNLDNFISISGTVEKGENMWDELATLIGETESEWAKDEFKDENSNSIVLLYCEGKYVYAFSNPEDQEEEDKVETSEDDTSLDDILKDLGYDSENLDLTMFDIDDQAIIKKSSDKIQKDKALTGLIYVNQKLEELGFEVDGHNPFFFTSVVHVSDKELSGFLYVNMDGFYSNCVYEKEIQMIFSWDSITDIKIIEEDEDSIKFNLYSNEGSLTIYEPYSKNTKILLSIYKNIWQDVVERFKSEGVIQWSVVEGEMGVNIYSFESHEEYLEWINN
jgi:hypothetical protein